jgi:hypothetical protein
MDYRIAPGSSLSADERDWLRDQAALLPGDAVIVQIGVERGASLYCSRAGNETATLIGVDLTFDMLQGEPDARLVQGDSRVVHKKVTPPIDFLFIDGDHSAAAVQADIENWTPKVTGVVAFHDYHRPGLLWCDGVREAVEAHDWTGWERIPAPDSIAAFRRERATDEGQG